MSIQASALLCAKRKGIFVNERGIVFGVRGNPIKLHIDSRGYYVFGVRYNGKVHKINVHRLQALQKYGNAIFKTGVEVRHLNNNRLDNSIENISIGTHSDNMNDMSEEKRKDKALNAALSNSNLTEEDILEIRNRIKNKDYTTYSCLAKEYGLKSKSSISDIANRRTWTHVQ